MEEVLGITFPYEAGTFSILRLVRFNAQNWYLYFTDPRITRTRPSGAKDIPEFRLLIQWGATRDLQKYSLCLRARKETLIPARARAWLEEQAAELDKENCSCGARNRIEVEDREKYLDIISCVSDRMTPESAQLLADKNGGRLETFRPTFDSMFTQVALDSLNFINIDQEYRDNLRKLAS